MSRSLPTIAKSTESGLTTTSTPGRCTGRSWHGSSVACATRPIRHIGGADQLAALTAGGYVRGIVDLRYAEPEQWTAADWRLLTTMGATRTPVHFLLERADITVGDYWAKHQAEAGLVRFMFLDLAAAIAHLAWDQFRRQALGEFARPCIA